jgi:transketolase
VWRPCDSVETLVAWQAALDRKEGPTSLIFSRQNSAHQARDEKTLKNIIKGGYILRDSVKKPQVILIGTGTEVEIAVQAAEKLAAQNIATRVISMPNMEHFLAQDKSYQEEVLLDKEGIAIGIDNFGKSAPAAHAYQNFNLTTDHVVEKVMSKLGE